MWQCGHSILEAARMASRSYLRRLTGGYLVLFLHAERNSRQDVALGILSLARILTIRSKRDVLVRDLGRVLVGLLVFAAVPLGEIAVAFVGTRSEQHNVAGDNFCPVPFASALPVIPA